MKKQQALLNELNIEKLKADNQESKKANIRVSLEEDAINQDAILKYSSIEAFSRRTGKLSVVNLGKATASNIVGSLPRHYCQPIHIGQLVPNEQRKFNIEWNDRGFFSKTALVKWDDYFATNRSNEIKFMNIPQGYKQTELGIIPEDWEVKSFSQIFDMYPNNTYPRDCMNDSRGVVRNIHYGDVLIKYPTIVDVEKCAIPYLNEDVKIKLQKLVQSGDIIIADTAEDETVGKCVEIKNVGNNKIVAGLHTFFCRPTTPFAAGWLGYYINSTNYHNQLIPYITGIKVSSISRTSIQETNCLFLLLRSRGRLRRR